MISVENDRFTGKEKHRYELGRFSRRYLYFFAAFTLDNGSLDSGVVLGWNIRMPHGPYRSEIPVYLLLDGQQRELEGEMDYSIGSETVTVFATVDAPEFREIAAAERFEFRIANFEGKLPQGALVKLREFAGAVPVTGEPAADRDEETN